MKIENIDIEKLRPAEYNPRMIDDETMEKLIYGIREFGIVDPLIINKDCTIIGGHQRYEAAKRIGIKSVPCVRLDLTKQKEMTLNIALNKIIGAFDVPKLSELLKDLEETNFELTGFTEKELADLEIREIENIGYREVEIRPYKKTHILISFPPEKLLYLKEHLEKIIAIEGVEYEQGSN